MTERNIIKALAEAQAEIKPPKKSRTATIPTKGGSKYTYQYADLDDVLKAVLPPLNKRGIFVRDETRIEGESIILKTVLEMAGDKRTVESEHPVCSVNQTQQAIGSAKTYARRYNLCGLIGISPVEDNDGETAAPGGNQPVQQMSTDQARREVNFPEVLEHIRSAKTIKQLQNLYQMYVNGRKGSWPADWVKTASDEIMLCRANLEVVNLEKALEKATTDEQRTEIWNDADIASKLEGFDEQAKAAFDLFQQSLDGAPL